MNAALGVLPLLLIQTAVMLLKAHTVLLHEPCVFWAIRRAELLCDSSMSTTEALNCVQWYNKMCHMVTSALQKQPAQRCKCSVTFCHQTMRLMALPVSQQPGKSLDKLYHIASFTGLPSPLVGPVADVRLTTALPVGLWLLKTCWLHFGTKHWHLSALPLCSSVRSTKGAGTSQLLSLDNRLGKPEHALQSRHNASCGPHVFFRLLKDVIWLSWHNRTVLLQLLPLCQHKLLSDCAVSQLRDTWWWKVNSEKRKLSCLFAFVHLVS